MHLIKDLVLTSQIMTASSSLPVASRAPDGEKHNDRIADALGCCNWVTSSPVCTKKHISCSNKQRSNDLKFSRAPMVGQALKLLSYPVLRKCSTGLQKGLKYLAHSILRYVPSLRRTISAATVQAKHMACQNLPGHSRGALCRQLSRTLRLSPEERTARHSRRICVPAAETLRIRRTGPPDPGSRHEQFCHSNRLQA